ASLPTVSKATDRLLGLSCLDGREPAASDKFDKLVPFGMAQPHNVICFADSDTMGVDDDLGTGAAFRTKARCNLFHRFHLLCVSGHAEGGAESRFKVKAPATNRPRTLVWPRSSLGCRPKVCAAT